MSGLTDFLLARIGEDEAVAREAVRDQNAYWLANEYGEVYEVVGSIDNPARCNDHGVGPNMCDDERIADAGAVDDDPHLIRTRGAHITRHDPVRVLGECEARRQIVNDFLETDSIALAAVDCCGPTRLRATWEAEDRAIRILASVYADHEDYRQEWRA